MTYAELIAWVKDTVDSTEDRFVGATGLNICIANAERSIYTAAIIPDNRKTTTVTVTSGTSSASLAQNVGAVLQVFRDGKRPLLRRTPSYMREMFWDCAQSEPTDYAWVRSTVSSGTTSNSILVGPTADDDYTFNVEYVTTDPPSIVSQTSGTWLSQNQPSVLRKQVLYEAAIFLKMSELIPTYKADADAALSGMVQMLGATASSDEEKS